MADAIDKFTRAVFAKTIVDGRGTVTVAGTAEAVSSTELVVDEVTFTAETNNTGVMATGASTVVATVLTRRGTPLLAGDSKTLEGVDLATVFFDATVSGDGYTYEYTK